MSGRLVGHDNNSNAPDITNNITRSVPSLATLLNEDEEDERMVHEQLAPTSTFDFLSSAPHHSKMLF